MPEAIWDGEVAGGDVEEVDGFWRRERTAERTGKVSMESGDRPSGRRVVRGCGVA